MDTPTAPDTAAPTTPQPVTPTVPSDWPGAFGLYKYSKTAVQFNLGTLLMLVVLSFAVSIVLSLFKLPGKILSELVGVVFSVAWTYAYLASVRGQKLDVEQAFQRCEPLLVLKYLANSILLVIILALSFVLLVVPFFFVLPRVLLAPYFLVDKRQGPIAAIQSSWQASRGHAGMLWGIMGASLAMALLCVTIIGIPFAVYFLFMYGAATALAYEFITTHTASAPPATTPAATDATPAS